MGISKGITSIKRVLLVKVFLVFFVWAPSLIAPIWLLKFLSVPLTSDLLYLRLFGALQASLGVAYWYAYRDPIKNSAIIKVCILENGLIALTILILGLTAGISSPFILGSAAVATLFCIILSVFYLKNESSFR